MTTCGARPDPARRRKGPGTTSRPARTEASHPAAGWDGGAEALGFKQGQVVEREPYDSLFGQRQAPDGTPLGGPPGGGRKAASIYAQLLAAEPQVPGQHRGRILAEGGIW